MRVEVNTAANWERECEREWGPMKNKNARRWYYCQWLWLQIEMKCGKSWISHIKHEHLIRRSFSLSATSPSPSLALFHSRSSVFYTFTRCHFDVRGSFSSRASIWYTYHSASIAICYYYPFYIAYDIEEYPRRVNGNFIYIHIIPANVMLIARYKGLITPYIFVPQEVGVWEWDELLLSCIEYYCYFARLLLITCCVCVCVSLFVVCACPAKLIDGSIYEILSLVRPICECGRRPMLLAIHDLVSMSMGERGCQIPKTDMASEN